MNMKLIKIFAAMLCILLTCCKEDEINWENSSNPSIEYTVEGVDFMFCLLDKNGNPSTTFKEWENFSFYFKMSNNREDELYVSEGISGLFCNPELGDLTTLDNQTIKHPISRACGRSLNTFPFYGDNKVIELTIPWNFDLESEYIVTKVHIPKGKYYTKFTHKFLYVFKDHSPSLSIDPLTFKIFFEIL